MKSDVVISIKDPLTISVSNTYDVTCERNKQDIITQINVPDFPPFEVGKKVIIGSRKVPYRINHIVKRESAGLPVYDLKIAHRTKASLFILPLFNGTRRKYFYEDLLLNCFVGVPGQERIVALLYRFSGVRQFAELEKAFLAMPNFIGSHDPDNFTVLYKFEVPENRMKDFELFLYGKYSEMSTPYKQRVLKFHGLTKTSSLGQILYKSKKRKAALEKMICDPSRNESLPEGAEVYSIPDLELETYDPAVYAL